MGKVRNFDIDKFYRDYISDAAKSLQDIYYLQIV